MILLLPAAMNPFTIYRLEMLTGHRVHGSVVAGTGRLAPHPQAPSHQLVTETIGQCTLGRMVPTPADDPEYTPAHE